MEPCGPASYLLLTMCLGLVHQPVSLPTLPVMLGHISGEFSYGKSGRGLVSQKSEHGKTCEPKGAVDSREIESPLPTSKNIPGDPRWLGPETRDGRASKGGF